MGAGADEVRAYRQPQDRQNARSRRAALKVMGKSATGNQSLTGEFQNGLQESWRAEVGSDSGSRDL